MRAADLFKRVALVTLPLAMMTGCDLLTDGNTDSNPPSTEAWENSTDLSSEFGGYDFASESPAFGDSEVLKIETAEASVDVAGEDASIADEPGAFALRILWGQLAGNRDASERLDWSGSVSLSSGAVAALRTIAFESPGDHLLRRENRQELGFVSHTRPHYDGLLLIIKAGDDPEATLTFSTGPLTETFRLADLRGADRVLRVDDLGNAVSLAGIEVDADPACARGGLRGRWLIRDGERGVFRGVWVTALGRPIGHLRGHFGVNEANQRVWFAKIINRDGDVIGLARGGWERSEDADRPGGVFAGHFAAREGAISGEVGGHFVATRHGDAATAGVFGGRWRTCNEGTEPGDEPSEPVGDRAGQ